MPTPDRTPPAAPAQRPPHIPHPTSLTSPPLPSALRLQPSPNIPNKCLRLLDLDAILTQLIRELHGAQQPLLATVPMPSPIPSVPRTDLALPASKFISRQPHARFTRRGRDADAAADRVAGTVAVFRRRRRAVFLRERELHVGRSLVLIVEFLVEGCDLVERLGIHNGGVGVRVVRRRAKRASDVVIRASDESALQRLDTLNGLPHLREARPNSLPHLGIVRPEGSSALVVEEGVVVHLQHLVRLAEAVPGAVVLAVDVDGAAVGFDGGVRVLHLDVLVAHERPGGEEGAVEGEGAAEVHDGFFVLRFEAVVVADHAACFGAEFVGCGGELGEEGEFGAGGHDVEDVGVVVEGVDAVRVVVHEGGEDGFGFVEVWRLVCSATDRAWSKEEGYLLNGRKGGLAGF